MPGRKSRFAKPALAAVMLIVASASLTASGADSLAAHNANIANDAHYADNAQNEQNEQNAQNAHNARGAIGAQGTPNSAKAGPVLLTIYLYDQCGGCESEGPGCGRCKDMDRVQGAVRSQLGDRLYDGSIEYRTFNSRTRVHFIGHIERCERYGVPADMQNIQPAAFIGADESGLYLLGDGLMPYIREMLDRYIAGENIHIIQDDVTGIFNAMNNN
jgi:hypothetical protein